MFQRRSDPTFGCGDRNILIQGGGLRHHGWCGVAGAHTQQKKKKTAGVAPAGERDNTMNSWMNKLETAAVKFILFAICLERNIIF